jgi:flagellar basal body P-ring formation chaperone FlgA
MRTGRIVDWALAGLVLFAPVAYGQAAGSSGGGSRFLIASARQGSGSEIASDEVIREGEMIREIIDPRNGDRWILTRDSSHPAGPGRLVLLASLHILTRHAVPEEEAQAPVIHAGDRVIVEEHTASVEARLEAVAMGPAQAGSPVNVRLSIGGRVLQAEAIGPEQAVFHAETQR